MSRALIASFIFLQILTSCSQKVSSQSSEISNASLSQSDIRAFILKETEEGGKFDFFTPIKGHEYDGIQIKPGIYDTKIGLAIYKWGKVNYDSGVKSLDEVYAIYSEYKKRPVNDIEKTYLKMGFGRELEK
ncbi:hypothetical protein JAO76_18245 [Pontibacter sp. BT310]|jgi:hypothetical protein|uniref:Uncharacterized protein n=1 Tax=Pontibacter populi TaxID=890055 RepID=A0ABS6XG86_9BACT|nr:MULTISPECIES: hypothetical protein [Pontibacter]MBJ6120152.1 hypothetical protein [Pontibacter sp. BT310]MBR0572585.1 hypothetical protein [Microvirga sp. STS03]MBW3367005.1 hypothetical protein [Pontibacter populi]